MKKLITLSFIVLLFTACKTTQTISETGTFEVLKQESYNGREKAAHVVIKSQKQLEAIYQELNLTDTPEVDFKIHNAVALFMGQKNTGGYSIGISTITIHDDTTVVHIIETAPLDMATMALTNPYCIAVIPKTDKVDFVKNTDAAAAE